MSDFVDLQKKLIPDILDKMQQRYAILHNVSLYQPIGRRALANYMKITERHLRAEVEFLEKQGLLSVTAKGMLTTKEGILILEQLSEFMNEIMGLHVLEKQLQDTLQVRKVIIVPGNSDEQSWIKQEMGKACVQYLKKIAKKDTTIAVTGGTSMAAVAQMMTQQEGDTSYLFVPARGGIGEKVENQANTIAAEMARKSNGEYRLLYVPDPLSETSYQTIINEPSINEILKIIKGADIVIHGIGDALAMAERRKTAEPIILKLTTNKAVSEAFGYYFNQQGEVVHKVRTVGIQLEDLATIHHVITIAGGKSKGQAIASYFKQGKSSLLITDEAAAQEILRDSSL